MLQETVDMAGIQARWLMQDSYDGRAGHSLCQVTIDALSSSPLHMHPNSSEVIHVIDGTMRLHVDGEHRDLKAGDTALVPAFTPHKTENITDRPVRLMVSCSSGSPVTELIDG